MSKEIDVVDRIEEMAQIAELWNQGEKSATVIAKKVGIKRSEVLAYIEEYKAILRNDPDVRERAKEALHEADNRLDMVVKRSWETVGQADDTGDIKTKATLLKNIADVEVKRVEMLQKAGLYDDAALGDELAEMEEKQALLVAILREVTADCDKCKFEVARRLSKVTGKVEAINIDQPVIEGEVVPNAD